MSSEVPAAGQRLGPYSLADLLGQGGFAWVYSATRGDGKSFAVKVLKPRYAADPRLRESLPPGGGLSQRGSSTPNIIHIEDVGAQEGFAYFVMDLYPDTLNARLGREGHLPEGDAVAIAIGVAQALSFAHERNIIHRDIKPDNILLGADGRPVLTDFGIARAVSGYVAATGFMMTIGTPAYISPEQAQGRPLDGRSDLYALGITIYRMLTGEVPFRSKDWFELARMHVEDRPEPPRNRHPEITKRMERIVLRLLAKPTPTTGSPPRTLCSMTWRTSRFRAGPRRTSPVPDGYLRDSKTLKSEEEAAKKKNWWKPWSKE